MFKSSKTFLKAIITSSMVLKGIQTILFSIKTRGTKNLHRNFYKFRKELGHKKRQPASIKWTRKFKGFRQRSPYKRCRLSYNMSRLNLVLIQRIFSPRYLNVKYFLVAKTKNKQNTFLFYSDISISYVHFVLRKEVNTFQIQSAC